MRSWGKKVVYCLFNSVCAREIITDLDVQDDTWSQKATCSSPFLLFLSIGDAVLFQACRPVLRWTGEPQSDRCGQRFPGLPVLRCQAAICSAHHQPEGRGRRPLRCTGFVLKRGCNTHGSFRWKCYLLVLFLVCLFVQIQILFSKCININVYVSSVMWKGLRVVTN